MDVDELFFKLSSFAGFPIYERAWHPAHESRSLALCSKLQLREIELIIITSCRKVVPYERIKHIHKVCHALNLLLTFKKSCLIIFVFFLIFPTLFTVS